jgi:hypothetical protein
MQSRDDSYIFRKPQGDNRGAVPRERQTNPLRKRKRGKVFTAADSTPIQARIPNAVFLEIERAARHELVIIADFLRAALLEKLERERNKSKTYLIISHCSTARLMAPRKIGATAPTPQNCRQMIPFRSRSDSWTFTLEQHAIGIESNFSRCPLFLGPGPHGGADYTAPLAQGLGHRLVRHRMSKQRCGPKSEL